MDSCSSKTHRARLALAMITGAVGLIISVGWLLKPRPAALPSDRAAATIVDPSAVASSATTAPNLSAPTTQLPPPNLRLTTHGALDQAILDTLNRLRAGIDPEKSRLLLEALKGNLLRPESKAEAIGAILGFLRSGEDAATGLAFRVGPKHALTEAPTLRTALLDWLGQLDSRAAADHSVQILAAMSSPEEYAVALRNFAQGRPEQRDELRNYFDRLASHGAWANQPTAGYLEAFDVVPHLADPAFINTLSPHLAPSAHHSLRHASLVALDRLVLANPKGSLHEMLRENALEDQPLLRASFLARADVRDRGQRELLEQYLLSSSLSERELDKFLRLFPNANRFASYNLLTESAGHSLADLAALDAAALERVREWQTQPRFSGLSPRLKQLENRLVEQVASAKRSGYLPREN
ncbi:MAG: hypothetical protein HY735_16645 [Verrucomicrobia bacterium]|nr:hypothetical protein [Verrucomicrobiota bacterium]